MATKSTIKHDGYIIVDKRVTIAVVLLVVGQIFYFGWASASATKRLERLEEDTPTIKLINERTIRIEEQVKAIRNAIAPIPR